MYHEIARNKRKSVLVVTLFFLFWAAAGFGIGILAGQSNGDPTAAGAAGAVIAADLGERPVAKALGDGSLMTYTAGIGRPSPSASVSTTS